MPSTYIPSDESVAEIAAKLLGDSSLFREVMEANQALQAGDTGGFIDPLESLLGRTGLEIPLRSEIGTIAAPALTSVRTGARYGSIAHSDRKGGYGILRPPTGVCGPHRAECRGKRDTRPHREWINSSAGGDRAIRGNYWNSAHHLVTRLGLPLRLPPGLAIEEREREEESIAPIAASRATER